MKRSIRCHVLAAIVLLSAMSIMGCASTRAKTRSTLPRTAITKVGFPEEQFDCADRLPLDLQAGVPSVRETSALVPIVVNQDLVLRTARPYDVIDITQNVKELVSSSGLLEGVVTVYSRHNTCVVRIGELESCFLDDFKAFMDSLAPRDRYYRHNDLAIRHEMRAKSPKDPEIDGYTHFHQMLIGNTSEAIPVVNGVPQLGTYQSVMVIELNQAVEPNQTLQRTIKLHLEGWRATGGDAATKPPEGN